MFRVSSTSLSTAWQSVGCAWSGCLRPAAQIPGRPCSMYSVSTLPLALAGKYYAVGVRAEKNRKKLIQRDSQLDSVKTLDEKKEFA